MEAYRNALIRRRLSPNTVRLRLFYLHKFAAVHDLTTATLEQMEDFVASNPAWSENTQQTIVASLRTYYKWAYKTGLISTNPAEDLLRVRVRRRPARIASDPAIRLGLENGTVEEKAMILLGAECGLRVSEIAKLHRSDRDGEWLTICGKGGVYRSVYVSPELLDLLEAIETTTIRHGNYFPGRSGSAMHPSTVWRRISRLVNINPHALRHRAATTVYRGTGNDIRTTQEFLGHASSATTERYVHVERDDLLRAANASRMAA